MLRTYQIGLAVERYLRRHCRKDEGPVDARRLAKEIYKRLPFREADVISDDRLLSLIIDRASSLGYAVRW